MAVIAVTQENAGLLVVGAPYVGVGLLYYIAVALDRGRRWRVPWDRVFRITFLVTVAAIGVLFVIALARG